MDYAGFYHSGDGVFRANFCPCLYAVETRACEYGHVGGRQYGSGIFVQSVQHDLAGILDESGLEAHVYYEAAAVIIALILLGRLLEAKAKFSTSTAIKKLMGLQPKNGD